MKHSFDFHFTYPVTYLPVRARTPKTIYLEGVEKIEIQGITRADTSIAIDLKVLNEFGNNEQRIERLAFEGEVYGVAMSNRLGDGKICSRGDFTYSASEPNRSRGRISDVIKDDAFSWVDLNAPISDALPFNADRIIESGLDRTIDMIREAAGKLIFIDDRLYVPDAAPPVLRLFGASKNERLMVFNKHRLNHAKWPVFDIERLDDALDLWRGFAGKRVCKESIDRIEVITWDHALTPAIDEAGINARSAIYRSLVALGPAICRMPSSGLAALAHLAAINEQSSSMPARDVLNQLEFLLSSAGPRPEADSEKDDREAMSIVRLCTSSLARSRGLDGALELDADTDLGCLKVS